MKGIRPILSTFRHVLFAAFAAAALAAPSVMATSPNASQPSCENGACGRCGDGFCNKRCGETAASCPGDCGTSTEI